MSDLYVHCWGEGTRVVLVHGSLATGDDEWQMQRPLALEGYRLLAPDRRGYGRSPSAEGEDFHRDAEDIAELMEGGAHLVGHSYGGLGAMLAAARRPESTLSLTLLEPATFTLGQQHPAGRALTAAVKSLWDVECADEEWLIRFLAIVGSELPPEVVTALVPLAAGGLNGRASCRFRN